MAIYTLTKEQFIKSSAGAVWEFFCNPDNLSFITPPYMKFRVTSSPFSGQIYPGQIITYTVAPVLGIPLFWMTEITHMRDGKFFVDEQRKGPYKLWHHQHHFQETDDGVLMTDIVHYELPYFILGKIAQKLFIKSQLEDIFEFRRRKIAAIFQ